MLHWTHFCSMKRSCGRSTLSWIDLLAGHVVDIELERADRVLVSEGRHRGRAHATRTAGHRMVSTFEYQRAHDVRHAGQLARSRATADTDELAGRRRRATIATIDHVEWLGGVERDGAMRHRAGTGREAA